MRRDVKKFLFVGIREEREKFFEMAQNFGIIQFINAHSIPIKESSTEIDNLTTAIKVLRGLTPVEQEETEEYAIADGLAYKIVQLKHNLEKLEEERRWLKQEIARVGVFGDFSLDDIEFIHDKADRKVQFFCAKHRIAEEGRIPDEAIYVDSDHNLDYYVIIDREPKQYDDMIEMRIDEPLGKLKVRQQEVHEQIQQTEERIKTYAKYNIFLHKALVYRLDTHNLQLNGRFAENKLEGDLFTVEGWVSTTKMEEMHQLVEELHVHFEEIAIEEEETAPTCLENEGFHRIGEDLVHVYDTPSNTDKDPSMWVLIWFAFFFAMIIGDGGYGCIFLAIAFYIRYKTGKLRTVGKRVWTLLVILATSCILWGGLTNSFFGITFDLESPLRKVSGLHWLVEKKAAYHIQSQDATYHEMVTKFPHLETVKDPHEFLAKGVVVKEGDTSYEIIDGISNAIMMELALLIGVIHLCLSCARYAGRNWSGIGWIAFMIGGYLYFPIYLNTVSMANYVLGLSREAAELDGQYLMMLGFGVAMVLAIIKDKLLGIFEITMVIQIFADILSYLRLYALALAGGIVTATINEYAGAMPLVPGFLLYFIGHVTNILLSVMGGVIHGLRLNFLEWYHYSFEGGGKLFNPLRKLAKEL